jgi:hypothetical protein
MLYFPSFVIFPTCILYHSKAFEPNSGYIYGKSQ